MIDAAAQRPAVPGVDQVKCQRRVNRNGRMQARRRLPRLEADARDRLARTVSLCHWHPPAVTGDDVAAFDKAASLDLQPLHRRIDIAHGAPGRLLFAENMPGLERLTHFQRDAAMMDPAERGKTEFKLCRVPIR